MLIDGADLTQMATGMNHELHTLQKYKLAIISGVATQVGPEWFSLKLQEKEMISANKASAIVDNLALSKEVKVNHLIQPVESKLKYGYNPEQIFKTFIEILSSDSVLKDLVQKLQTGKCATQLLFSTVACNSVCFRVHRMPYNTKH